MSTPARVLDGGDVRRLLAHVRGHRHAARDTVMILLSFKAGLRACEIAGLDWTMVLKPNGRLGTQLAIAGAIAKNGRARLLPMNAELAIALGGLHIAVGRVREGAVTVQPPPDAVKLAEEIAWVVCGAGMNVRVAGRIHAACMRQVRKGRSACKVFNHKGKCAAIDFCWRNRELLHAEYLAADDKLAWCASLPWIGPVTKYHLAKNLGLDVPKPDVHLERLARAEDILPFELCERLAEESGFRIATVDTILWRACADGILDSGLYRSDGWEAAYRPGPNDARLLADGGGA